MNKYLDAYRIYHMIMDHGIASVVTIHNIGTTKATDVPATIEFPNEILVLDISEVRKMREPKKPNKPRNLIEIAYERANRSWMPPSSAVDWNGHKEDLSMFSFRRLDTYTIRNTAFDAMNINDNTVYIETTHGIVHTK